MCTDYEVHTDLIDNSIEVTIELKQEIQRVADVVVHYNSKSTKTKEDADWLSTIVDNFNFDQKYQAVRCKCSNPVGMLDLFIKQRVVPQIKIAPHSSDKLYGIEFYTYFLDFRDFYNTNKEAFPKYDEFMQVLSLFLHNLHEELTRGENHNSLFPYLPVHVNKTLDLIENKNPYTAYSPPLEWSNRLILSDVTTKSALNRMFASIITYYFPGLPFKFFTRIMWNSIFYYVKDGHRLQSTMDYLLQLVWRQAYFNPSQHGQSVDNSPTFYRPITRHIAWCENERNRICTKFHFECHSSVNCPFYRESTLKRQNKEYY